MLGCSGCSLKSDSRYGKDATYYLLHMDEIRAGALLNDARAHFKAKRFTAAQKSLSILTHEFSHTDTYKRNYEWKDKPKPKKKSAPEK